MTDQARLFGFDFEKPEELFRGSGILYFPGICDEFECAYRAECRGQEVGGDAWCFKAIRGEQ